jgi:cytosine/adenosine deaminase-related metal-dependent hydrolase
LPRQRFKSRHLAGVVPASDDEYGLYAVPHDAGRGVGWVTLNGAKALGLDTVCGSLEAGKEASFVAWDIAHPAELSYWLGGSLSKQVIYQGKEVYCD